MANVRICTVEDCNNPRHSKAPNCKYCAEHRDQKRQESLKNRTVQRRSFRRADSRKYNDPTAPYIFQRCTNYNFLDSVNEHLRQNGGVYYPKKGAL